MPTNSGPSGGALLALGHSSSVMLVGAEASSVSVRFSDPEEMPPDPLGADRSLEREQFAQQSDRQAIGNQRGEFGLQIQHLRTDAFAQQLRQRAHRARRPLQAHGQVRSRSLSSRRAPNGVRNTI